MPMSADEDETGPRTTEESVIDRTVDYEDHPEGRSFCVRWYLLQHLCGDLGSRNFPAEQLRPALLAPY